MNIKFLSSTGDSKWFDIDGEIYGISYDGSILDCDGMKMTGDWLAQNQNIIDALTAGGC